jgi:hypothetical protein
MMFRLQGDVTGIQPSRVRAAKESFQPKDWGLAWIPATSAGMRVVGVPLAPYLYPCGRGRKIITLAC